MGGGAAVTRTALEPAETLLGSALAFGDAVFTREPHPNACPISSASAKSRCNKTTRTLPFMPLYWMCLFVPTYKAAYEYIRKPYYWAKTTHGVASHLPSASPALAAPQSIPVQPRQPIKTHAIAEKRKAPFLMASLNPAADVLDKAAE